MDVFVTATSPVARRVRVIVQERTVCLNWAGERSHGPPSQVEYVRYRLDEQVEGAVAPGGS